MKSYVKSGLCIVLSGWVCLTVLGCHAGQLKQIQAKEDNVKELRVNLVLEVKPAPDGKEHEVVTDRSGKLRLVEAEPLRIANWYAAKRLPASIEYEPDTRLISSVSSAPTDVLIALSDAQDAADHVSVHLMKRQTLTYLYKDNPRFAALYDLLERAHREKKQVALGILPAGDRIEDVRVDDWKMPPAPPASPAP